MPDLLQNLKVEDVKTKLSCESESGKCENEAFVRDVRQKLKEEDVKTQLSCETSFKFLKVQVEQDDA